MEINFELISELKYCYMIKQFSQNMNPFNYIYYFIRSLKILAFNSKEDRERILLVSIIKNYYNLKKELKQERV